MKAETPTLTPAEQLERHAMTLDAHANSIELQPSQELIARVVEPLLIKALRAGASALRAPSGWQAIATHDGSSDPVLIGWWDDEGVWQSRQAWFEREFAVEGYADDEDMTTIWQQAWTDNRVASIGYEEVWEYEPTHWRPLPSPPVPEDSK